MELINSVYDHVSFFFNLPIDAKMRVQRHRGTFSGYSFANADRFSLNLPWKEIFSCIFGEGGDDSEMPFNFSESALGQEFEKREFIFIDYCCSWLIS